MKCAKRKNDGIVTAQSTIKLPYKEIIKLGLEPQSYFDPWCASHDGIKYESDRTLMNKPWKGTWSTLEDESKKYSKKNRKHLIIRKIRKLKKLNQKFFIT